MGRGEAFAGDVSAAGEIAPVLVMTPGMECRVCELETENARLRLLVGELLVANQRLRERGARPRMEEPAS
jgi:hypothetical protein